MSDKKLVFPNVADSFVIAELRERLAAGHTVRMAFGGDSMKPMISGLCDKVEFMPVVQPLRKRDVYLFVCQGKCVVHRLIRIDGDQLTFRGDNCAGCEYVGRDDVIARLSAVVKPDGSVQSCDSKEWIRRSRWVVSRRTALNTLYKLFSRTRRRWERWLYFAIVLALMWMPAGLLGVPLNNFVFGIRADHLLHASVYIPCAFFMMDFFYTSKSRMFFSWLSALLMGMLTETVQYLLPYRGFDVNDLVANAFGVTLGLVLLLIAKQKSR